LISPKNNFVLAIFASLLFCSLAFSAQEEPRKHFGATVPQQPRLRWPHQALDELYSAPGLPLPIEDLHTTVATITVAESFNVEDVDVGLTISHPWVRDLTIWLERDTTYLDSFYVRRDTVWENDTTWYWDSLWQDTIINTVAQALLLDLFPGDDIINMTDTWFDDESRTGIYEGLPPFTGVYRPLRSMDSLFVGHDAHGQWRLVVRDRFLGDEGSLESFSIEINGVQQLRGTVTGSACGLPVGGASVVVQDVALVDTLAMTTTATNGTYGFSRLTPGDYALVFRAANYDSVVISPVTIDGVNPTVVDAILNTSSATCDVTFAGPDIAIPDQTRIEVPLEVSISSTVLDLDVTVNCRSTWITELRMALWHPDGDSVMLFSYGDTIPDLGDNMVNCRFDDEAAQSYFTSEGPFTGTFRPLEPLSRFDARSPQGEWMFSADDYGAGDTGVLQNFTLHFSLPVSADDNDAVLPESFQLHPAYPNPFNPSTALSLDVARAGDYQLEVFDVTGRLVATLYDGKLGAGRHEFHWTALKASSGLYFARAKSAVQQQTVKLVLLK